MIDIDALSEEIAQQLVGQCVISLDQALEERELDIASAPRELLEAIDDKVFCCATCDWYCSTDEANEGPNGDVCDDCDESDEE